MSDYVVDMDVWTGAAVEALHFTNGPGVTLGEMGVTNYILQSATYNSGAPWYHQNITKTTDSTKMVDGITDAVKLLETTANGYHQLYPIAPELVLPYLGVWTFSVPIKGGLSRDWIFLSIGITSTYFNITTGSIGVVGSGATAKIVDEGDGWWLCSITHILSAGGPTPTVYPSIGICEADNDALFIGVITKGVYLGISQIEAQGITSSRIITTTTPVSRVDARIYYAPRINNPGSFKTMMFSEGTTRGQSKIGSGEVRLDNTDGTLDVLAEYGYGRDIMIRELLAGGLIGLTLSCTTEQPVFDLDEITIRIKDPQARLNVPLQANKYGGTNVNGEGVDGEADIKNTPKPLAYGDVFNCTPVCVNSAKQIYQANDGAMQAISAVRDKGVPLQMDTAYASQADLEAAAPPPGYYACHLASGLFRLGSAPVGAITFDGLQGVNAAARTVAQIAQQIALRTLSAGDLVDADFTALDSLNSAVIGGYWREETTVGAALVEVMDSIGAWAAFDYELKLHVGQVVAPTGTADIELTTAHIQQIQRIATQDEGRGVPAWKINMGFRKNHTLQDAGGLAANINNLIWRQGGDSLSYGSWEGVVYGNGLFAVLVQSSNKIMTSSDGVTWTERTLPSSELWSCITYDNGKFVIAAYGTNKAATSTDGITWTARTLPSSQYWHRATYGNGLFVIIEAVSNKAATSSDGVTWTERTLPSSELWSAVAYGNGVFVIVADSSNKAATSSDGITWTARTLPSFSSWKNLAYGNGLFIAIAEGTDKAATSPDGITWTARTLPSTNNWRGVLYGDFLFVMLSHGSDITLTSPDGITWTQLAMPTTLYASGIAYGNGRFIALSSWYSYLLKIKPSVEDIIVLNKEYQTVTAYDADIKTPHPNAPTLEYTSLLAAEADAQDEVDRQFAIRSVRSDFFAVTIPRKSQSIMPMFGQVVNVTYPRYGCNSGKKFMLMGYNLELETDELTLYIWRPDV